MSVRTICAPVKKPTHKNKNSAKFKGAAAHHICTICAVWNTSDVRHIVQTIPDRAQPDSNTHTQSKVVGRKEVVTSTTIQPHSCALVPVLENHTRSYKQLFIFNVYLQPHPPSHTRTTPKIHAHSCDQYSGACFSFLMFDF